MTAASRASELGLLPNLIVIGAQKCGTTSLHNYLDLHPEIQMSRRKETNFFLQEHDWSRGIDPGETRFDRSAVVRGRHPPTTPTCPRQRARRNAFTGSSQTPSSSTSSAIRSNAWCRITSTCGPRPGNRGRSPRRFRTRRVHT